MQSSYKVSLSVLKDTEKKAKKKTCYIRRALPAVRAGEKNIHIVQTFAPTPCLSSQQSDT